MKKSKELFLLPQVRGGMDFGGQAWYMDRNARVRALIGFILGALMGATISVAGEWFENWLVVRRGLPSHPIKWWDALPLAIIMGLALAINMYRSPFGD